MCGYLSIVIICGVLSTPLLASREENTQKGPKAAAAEAGARRGEVTDCGRSNSLGSRAGNEPSRSFTITSTYHGFSIVSLMCQC